MSYNKLDYNNCSCQVIEKLFSDVKIVDGYKLVVKALGTDYEKRDFVFTVKTDINDDYYVSYYSDRNGMDYSIFVDGFTEIIDLIDLLNRKENIDCFLSVQEGESCNS